MLVEDFYSVSRKSASLPGKAPVGGKGGDEGVEASIVLPVWGLSGSWIVMGMGRFYVM